MRNNKLLSVALLVLLMGSPLLAHNYYASLTRLNHNQRSGTLEIIHRLTAHDADAVVSIEAGEATSFINSEDFDRAQTALGRYLGRRFILSSDGQPLDLRYLGAELSGDVIYAYSEVKVDQWPEPLTVDNRIFTDIFDQQQNLVVATTGDLRASLQFNAGDSPKTLLFNDG